MRLGIVLRNAARTPDAADDAGILPGSRDLRSIIGLQNLWPDGFKLGVLNLKRMKLLAEVVAAEETVKVRAHKVDEA